MDNDEMLIVIKDMFEKSIEKIEIKFDEKIKEVKNHMGAIAEDLRGDVKAIAEGHDILNSKIDKLQSDLIETKEEIRNVKKDMLLVLMKN